MDLAVRLTRAGLGFAALFMGAGALLIVLHTILTLAGWAFGISLL